MGWEKEERSELVGIPEEAIFWNNAFKRSVQVWERFSAELVPSSGQLLQLQHYPLRGPARPRAAQKRMKDLEARRQMGNFMSSLFQKLDLWVQGRTGLTPVHRHSAHLGSSGLLRRLAVFASSPVSSCCCPMVMFFSWLLADFITSAWVYDFFFENPTSF